MESAKKDELLMEIRKTKEALKEEFDEADQEMERDLILLCWKLDSCIREYMKKDDNFDMENIVARKKILLKNELF